MTWNPEELDIKVKIFEDVKKMFNFNDEWGRTEFKNI